MTIWIGGRIRVVRRKIAHSNVLFRVGEGPPLVDPTCGRAVQEDFVIVAADTAAGHFKTNQLAGDAPLLLACQCGAADKFALVELDDPASPASKGVMVAWISWPYSAMPASSRSVLRAPKTAWLDAEFLPGVEDIVPNAFGMLGRK